MTVGVLLGAIFVLVAINIFLWKYGFVHEAERPEVVEDDPVKLSKEKKAVLIRRIRNTIPAALQR